MRRFLTLSTIALALAACAGDGDSASQGKGDSAEFAKSETPNTPFKVQPGLWETKIIFKTVDAKAMPEAAKQQIISAMGKGITVKSCVTKEQAEKPGAEFFGSPNGSNCSVDNMNVTGDRMSVKLTCKPDGKTVIHSTMIGTFRA